MSATTTRRGTQTADFRPVRANELERCAEIWRVSINDYLVRLHQPEIPDDLASITGLYRHLQATDPERFVVATRPNIPAAGSSGEPGASLEPAERIVGFVVALVRGNLWFLSMLFVLPEEQGLGLGRALLDRVLPAAGSGMALATATDSAQPISNALYSTLGIVPRMPLLHLLGEVRRPEALPDLPAGITSISFDAVASGPRDDEGHRELAATIGQLDRDIAGFEHPEDHGHLRLSGRRAFIYRDGSGTVVGYGYTSEIGRVGPIAVRDASLVGPVLGHLLRAVQPRGAFATWVPGAAGAAVTALLAAGLQLEIFPILVCWDRPFADFSRYLPISPGLL